MLLVTISSSKETHRLVNSESTGSRDTAWQCSVSLMDYCSASDVLGVELSDLRSLVASFE